jgi:hypothetical protein
MMNKEKDLPGDYGLIQRQGEQFQAFNLAGRMLFCKAGGKDARTTPVP